MVSALKPQKKSRKSAKPKRISKAEMDALVQQYKTPDFIADDPLSFPYRFKDDPKACEMVGFVTALMSYGRRDSILKFVNSLLERMDGDPAGFVEGYSEAVAKKAFEGLVYRFNRAEDFVFLFGRLHDIYAADSVTGGTLESFFMHEQPTAQALDLRERVSSFMARLQEGASPALRERYGMKFLLSTPERGAACKRFNMFLRWMVRDDGLDLGLWKQSLTPADLLIPLDTHVARMGRERGLLLRKANDWQAVEELTANLRRFSREDPVRYDFAMFGSGVAVS